MIIFPAVDIRNGKCVRLIQGRVEQETVYFEDPVAVAQEWESQGAEWLHLVDLDGAMSSGTGNRSIAKKIFKTLRIPVQFGGGESADAAVGQDAWQRRGEAEAVGQHELLPVDAEFAAEEAVAIEHVADQRLGRGSNRC